ncbi:MAG: TetR/AcrR family transcriptional regulator [Burkholderiales bacterium]
MTSVSAPRSGKKSLQPAPAAKRLSPEDREQQIVAKAIEHFTRQGFAGSTRELAREIGVTQPLLYRYFPNKEALVDRVYKEVFSWGPTWEAGLTDRAVPLVQRLYRFYGDYSKVILREEWIRIFIFAGLTREGINTKYLNKLRSRVFLPLLEEIRAEYGIPEPRTAAELETEIELVWSLHASIFYLGVRKWIYGLRIPKDIDALIRREVDAFLHGTPEVMKALRREAALA